MSTAADFYWYHRLDLGNGEVTNGDYDIAQFIERIGFPPMAGLDVLDVGRSSGAFSFEFERRGARVVSTDLPSFFDWDFADEASKSGTAAAVSGGEAEFSRHQIFGAFEYAKDQLASSVVDKRASIYDISPEMFGGKTFDLVFCGSLLCHLRDPALALRRLRSVTNKTCIVTTPISNGWRFGRLPHMILVDDTMGRSWWLMSPSCVVGLMKRAGFQEAHVHGYLTIRNRKHRMNVKHAVVHATI